MKNQPVKTPDSETDEDVANSSEVTIGKRSYRLEERIGRGRYASVYRAFDSADGVECAVKLMKTGEETHAGELDFAARLDYPGLVSPVHSGESDRGGLGIVTPFIRGIPVTGFFREYPPGRDTGLFRMLVRELLEIIRYLHDRDMLHLDLKPDHILIDPDPLLLEGAPGAGSERTAPRPPLHPGATAETEPDRAPPRPSVCLLDLGSLCFVREKPHAAGVRGTPAYMAPEWRSGRKADQRTDIYSLGIILHELRELSTSVTADPAPVKQAPRDPGRPGVHRPEGFASSAPNGPGTRLPGSFSETLDAMISPDPSVRPWNIDETVKGLGLEQDLTPFLREVAPFKSRFAGRRREIELFLDRAGELCDAGKGGIVLVRGKEGAGRSRFIREAEFSVRATFEACWKTAAPGIFDLEAAGRVKRQLGGGNDPLFVAADGCTGFDREALASLDGEPVLIIAAAATGPGSDGCEGGFKDALSPAASTHCLEIHLPPLKAASVAELFEPFMQDRENRRRLGERIVRDSGGDCRRFPAAAANVFDEKDSFSPVAGLRRIMRETGTAGSYEAAIRLLRENLAAGDRRNAFLYTRISAKLCPARERRAGLHLLGASLSRLTGNFDRAMLHLERYISLARERSSPAAAVHGGILSVEVLARAGRFDEARKKAEQLLKGDLGSPGEPEREFCLALLGRILERQGELAAGRRLLEERLSETSGQTESTSDPSATTSGRSVATSSPGTKTSVHGTSTSESGAATSDRDSDTSDPDIGTRPSRRRNRARAALLSALGAIYTKLGESEKADSAMREAFGRLGMPSDYVESSFPNPRASLSGGLGILAACANNYGVLLWKKGDLDGAEKAFSRALFLREREGDALYIASAADNLAAVSYRLGAGKRSLDLFHHALSCRLDADDLRGAANSLNNIGVVHQDAERWGLALRTHREALAVRRRINDREGMAVSTHNLGLLERKRGRYEAALHYYAESLALKEELGDRAGIVRTRCNRAVLHLARGDGNRAGAEVAAAIPLADKLDSPELVFLTRHVQALALREKGDSTAAAALLESIRRLPEGEEAGVHDEQRLQCSLDLAETLIGLGKESEAAGILDGIGDEIKKLGDRRLLLSFNRNSAAAAFRSGRPEECRKLCARAVRLVADSPCEPLEEAKLALLVGRMAASEKRFDQAAEAFDRARELAVALGNDHLAAGIPGTTAGGSPDDTAAASGDERLTAGIPGTAAGGSPDDTAAASGDERLTAGIPGGPGAGALDDSADAATGDSDAAGEPPFVSKGKDGAPMGRKLVHALSRKREFPEDALAAVREMTGALNSLMELNDLLEKLLDLVLGAVGGERGVILLDDGNDEFRATATRGMDPLTVEDAKEYSRTIVNRAFNEERFIFSPNAAADAAFADQLSVSRLGIVSFMCCPLVRKGNAIGTVYVDNRSEIDSFNEKDRDILLTFANLAAVAIEGARLAAEIRSENVRLKRVVGEETAFPRIVGASPAMRRLFKIMERLLDNDIPVLIQGETGSGKELVARALHYQGRRKDRPFVAVDCGILHENLVESELFGHEKGAFSGAVTRRAGLFEEADGGTIFLDEISNLGVQLQAKLLRVLQEGEFRRVGETRVRRTDVRVICATNRDLRAEVAEGRFREDLYYRIRIVALDIPPLRERVEDIPLLVDFFSERIEEKYRVSFPRLTGRAHKALLSYDWPGNVRQLENILAGLPVLCPAGAADVDMLPEEISGGFKPSGGLSGGGASDFSDGGAGGLPAGSAGDVREETGRMDSDSRDAEPRETPRAAPAVLNLDDREKQGILSALEKTGWVQTRAALLLGVSERSLRYKMAKFGIVNPRLEERRKRRKADKNVDNFVE